MHRRLFCVLIFVGSLAWSQASLARTFVIPRHFATIQEAVDSSHVADGDTLIVERGRHAGAVLTKTLVIIGRPGAVIDSGPVFIADYPCVGDMRIGFQLGFSGEHEGSGSVIRNLVFDNLEFPVYGFEVDDVSVSDNDMRNPIQGVTNRGGRGWRIVKNHIRDMRTANGGGIGIFITDADLRPGGVVNNDISGNAITGTLQVSSCDFGGYDGIGVALNADFRYGALGAEAISENLISWNKIHLISDAPSIVDVVGIVLEDSRNEEEFDPVVFDNVILFNDLRRMENPLIFAPAWLEDANFAAMNWLAHSGHEGHGKTRWNRPRER